MSRHQSFQIRVPNTTVSDTIDSAESGQSVDTGWENRVVRNLWMIKGFAAAVALTGFGYASLTVIGHEMGNVLWGMAVTLAAFLVLIEVALGTFRAVNST